MKILDFGLRVFDSYSYRLGLRAYRIIYIKQVKGRHTVSITAYEKCLSSYVVVKPTSILIAFIWKSPGGERVGGGKSLLPTEVSFNALSPSSDQQQ